MSSNIEESRSICSSSQRDGFASQAVPGAFTVVDFRPCCIPNE